MQGGQRCAIRVPLHRLKCPDFANLYSFSGGRQFIILMAEGRSALGYIL